MQDDDAIAWIITRTTVNSDKREPNAIQPEARVCVRAREREKAHRKNIYIYRENNAESSQIRMNKFENIKIIYSNVNRTTFSGIQNKVIYLVMCIDKAKK